MDILGNLKLVGLGHIANARIEQLAADPEVLVAGLLWYNTTDGVYRGYDGTSVVTFASAAALAAVISGTGLESDGSYEADATSNYLASATSLYDADQRLDTALKALSDVVDAIEPGGDIGPLQIEIDAIETGAGLASDGTYSPNAGTHYIGAATSLRSADELLDAALNTVSGVASGAASAASTAQGAAEAAQDTADNALARSGGTMTGVINMGGNAISNVPSPANAGDAVNRAYVDTLFAGLDFQADVLGIQVDGTLQPSLVAGARYIITNAADLHEDFGTIAGVQNNDIVQYDGSDWVVVYDVSDKGEGAMVWSRGASTFYFYDGTAWTAFGGLSGIEAGIGLQKDGNVLNVLLGAGIADLPEGEVAIDLRSNSGLWLTEDGTTASSGSDAQLALRLDGGTLAVGAGGVKVADAGITATQIAAAALGNGLTGGSGTALSVQLDTDSGLLLGANGLSFDASLLDDYLALGGGTMTGALVLAADPANAMEAATKQYVDAVRTDLQTALEGSTFIYDGSVSAASHEVVHNIGSKYCNVTVVDSGDNVIIPDSVSFDDANTLTVSFATAITCKVIVTSKYVAPVGP